MIRLLVSDVLNGACFAALIVLAAGQAPKISASSAVPAQDIVERARFQVYAPVERVSGGLSPEPEREPMRVSASETETASATAGNGVHESGPLSLSGQTSATQPALDVAARKPSGGLSAAADGGIDAYVPPIVRQRPVTPSLKREAKPKGKEKVKAAASAKNKSDAKQASRAVAPASVKR